jgi:hypothetical protein
MKDEIVVLDVPEKHQTVRFTPTQLKLNLGIKLRVI